MDYTLFFYYSVDKINKQEIIAILNKLMPFECQWFTTDLMDDGNWFNSNTFNQLLETTIEDFSLFDKHYDSYTERLDFGFYSNYNYSSFHYSFSNIGDLNFDFVNELSLVEGLIFGCIYNSDDVRWQSEEDIETLIQFDKASLLERLAYMSGRKSISIAKNYGRRKLVGDLYLIAAPLMWFGEGYYKYIPKEKLLGFKSCNKNIQLDSKRIFIELFDVKDDPSKSNNRKKQKQFRVWVDMDNIEKRLSNKSKV